MPSPSLELHSTRRRPNSELNGTPRHDAHVSASTLLLQVPGDIVIFDEPNDRLRNDFRPRRAS